MFSILRRNREKLQAMQKIELPRPQPGKVIDLNNTPGYEKWHKKNFPKKHPKRVPPIPKLKEAMNRYQNSTKTMSRKV